ncbi:hypothetical protein FF1_003492 [Malus domestica]
MPESSWFYQVALILTLRLYKAEPPSSKLKPCSFAASSQASVSPTSLRTTPQRRLSSSAWHGSSLSRSPSSEL